MGLRGTTGLYVTLVFNLPQKFPRAGKAFYSLILAVTEVSPGEEKRKGGTVLGELGLS